MPKFPRSCQISSQISAGSAKFVDMGTKGTATRGPEGPESGQNMRVRGPEGREDEQSSVPVLELASATICFSRFSQKSRFSWHNLSTLMTAKMHENFNRDLYLQYEHRVKKLKHFVDKNRSYTRLKFRKIEVFVSKRGTTYRYISRRPRTHFS